MSGPSTQYEAALKAFLPLTFLSFAPPLIFFAVDLFFSSSSSLFGLECSWSRSSFLFPSTTTTTTTTTMRRRRSLRKNLEALPGKHSMDSLQKTATRILGTSHIICKVLQCETWSLRGGDHRWFKRRTWKKRPVTRDDDDDGDNNNNVTFCR